MGNQISCDIGTVFIEITIKLSELPCEYPLSKYFYSENQNSTYYFLHFERSKIQEFKSHPLFAKIEKNLIPVQVSGITYDNFYKILPTTFEHSFIEAKKHNYSLESLNFYWKTSHDRFFTFKTLTPPLSDGSLTISETMYQKSVYNSSDFYPFLLISVKSGVSIYLVTSEEHFEKIGGSCLGLSSIWGILKSQEIENIDDLYNEILTGMNNNVDMTVGDIYGCGYLNLPDKLTASSCGKLKDRVVYNVKDLAKSLMFMLMFNLGQISAMHCFDLHISRAIVVGSALYNEHLEKMMNFAFNYSSQGRIELIFCENSQYLRSMGVLHKSHEENI